MGEKVEERMLKENWKTHYLGPCPREEELQAFYMLELSKEELSPGEESEEQEDNDYYVDLTGLIMDLQAAERQEYGKSNLKSDDGFDEALKKHPQNCKVSYADTRWCSVLLCHQGHAKS